MHQRDSKSQSIDIKHLGLNLEVFFQRASPFLQTKGFGEGAACKEGIFFNDSI